MVGLADDERCFIHNLRVKKHCRSFVIITNVFSNIKHHLNC